MTELELLDVVRKLCKVRDLDWNPLQDSGDCADLEEYLGITVTFTANAALAWHPDSTMHQIELRMDHNGDRQSARRWASVRKAAELAARS